MSDIHVLARYIRYDPVSGKLFWKSAPKKYGLVSNYTHSRSLERGGTEALNTRDKSGYLVGSFRNIPLKAHRVAWALHYGQWPTGQIDHINGDVSDNRIQNLRDVSNTTNQRNSRKRRDNSSGYVGVSFHKKTGKYRARVKIDGKEIFLGNFDAPDQAFLARVSYLFRNNLIGNADGFTLRHAKPRTTNEQKLPNATDFSA